jgi:Zn-finger nucleic acid-binding protein
MGAPAEPTCPRCRGEGLDPGLRAAILEAIEQAEAVPAG